MQKIFQLYDNIKTKLTENKYLVGGGVVTLLIGGLVTIIGGIFGYKKYQGSESSSSQDDKSPSKGNSLPNKDDKPSSSDKKSSYEDDESSGEDSNLISKPTEDQKKHLEEMKTEYKKKYERANELHDKKNLQQELSNQETEKIEELDKIFGPFFHLLDESESDAQKKALSMIELIKKHEWLIGYVGHSNEDLLHVFANFGSVDGIKFCLERGFDINAKNKNELTPLHIAAKYGSSESVKLLLENEVDINAKDKEGLTPLHIAAEYGNPESVKLLLESGADINAKDKNEFTPLHKAADRVYWIRMNPKDILKDVLKIVEILATSPKLDVGVHYTMYGNNSNYLHCLADKLVVKDEDESNSVSDIFDKMVKSLVFDKGLDINAKNGANITALNDIIFYNFREEKLFPMAKVLLKNNATVDISNIKKQLYGVSRFQGFIEYLTKSWIKDKKENPSLQFPPEYLEPLKGVLNTKKLLESESSILKQFIGGDLGNLVQNFQSFCDNNDCPEVATLFLDQSYKLNN